MRARTSGPGDFRLEPRPFRSGVPQGPCGCAGGGDTGGWRHPVAGKGCGSVLFLVAFAGNLVSGGEGLPTVSEALRMNENQPGREWASVPAEGEYVRNPELLERKEVIKELGCRDAGGIGVKGTRDFFVLLMQLF